MTYLPESDYNRAVGKILAGKALDPDEALAFIATVSKFESLLDDANDFDVFGTEGWQHHLNWN